MLLASIVKIGAWKAVLSVQAEIIYNSHACMCLQTVWHFESKERLGKVCALRNGRHRLQSCAVWTDMWPFVCLSQLTASRSVGWRVRSVHSVCSGITWHTRSRAILEKLTVAQFPYVSLSRHPHIHFSLSHLRLVFHAKFSLQVSLTILVYVFTMRAACPVSLMPIVLTSQWNTYIFH